MSELCIKIKDFQFAHLPVFDGAGDSVHCTFCMKTWETRELALLEIASLREEDYPGQDYFWRVNENIRKTEENWYASKLARIS